MEEQDALLEQTRRYFTNYGPGLHPGCGLLFRFLAGGDQKAAGPGFLWKQPNARGQRLFSLHSGRMPEQAIPDCLLLAGFDPLVLGYEKKQSIFLPPEYLRGIFSLSGIVMPPVLLHGSVAGRWKHSGKRLLITQFRPFSQEERGFAEAAAAQLWDEAVQPVFQDA